ncbi:MAG: M15 family metallopeptidase [Acidimicrobiales bacterium]|nr:M15 family metallopeptidase [Acidimicrobiales bacterium]
MRRIVVVGSLVVAALLPIAPAAAQTSGTTKAPSTTAKPSLADLQKQRDEVRRKKAAVAGQVDGLKVDASEAAKALGALDDNVAAVQREYDDAQADVDAAQGAADQAKAAKEASSARITELEQAVRRAAVRSYVNGGVTNSLLLSDLTDAADAIRRQTLMGVAAGDTVNLVDELDAAKDDYARSQKAAETAAAQLAVKRDAVDVRLTELESARQAQAKLADQLDDRLSDALRESSALAKLDQKFADQIVAEQKAIADALAKAAAERARQAALARPTNVATPTPIGPVSLSTVRGITVASSIAGNLGALLSAAERDGISLGGSGYRDQAEQIALRRAHCGSSDYAIWSAPSSSCRPPTAKPGSSMHERGLAIDFTYNGSVIGSRGSAGYQWLAANAGRFGLYNLPSEPWHWSTTGN